MEENAMITTAIRNEHDAREGVYIPSAHSVGFVSDRRETSWPTRPIWHG
jgi:hypothetical protein